MERSYFTDPNYGRGRGGGAFGDGPSGAASASSTSRACFRVPPGGGEGNRGGGEGLRAATRPGFLSPRLDGKLVYVQTGRTQGATVGGRVLSKCGSCTRDGQHRGCRGNGNPDRDGWTRSESVVHRARRDLGVAVRRADRHHRGPRCPAAGAWGARRPALAVRVSLRQQALIRTTVGRPRSLTEAGFLMVRTLRGRGASIEDAERIRPTNWPTRHSTRGPRRYGRLFADDGEWLGGPATARDRAGITAMLTGRLGPATQPRRPSPGHGGPESGVDVRGGLATARSTWAADPARRGDTPVMRSSATTTSLTCASARRWR